MTRHFYAGERDAEGMIAPLSGIAEQESTFAVTAARCRVIMDALGYRCGDAVFQVPIEDFLFRTHDWRNPFVEWETLKCLPYLPDITCRNMPDDYYAAMRIPQLHEMAFEAALLGADTIACL